MFFVTSFFSGFKTNLKQIRMLCSFCLFYAMCNQGCNLVKCKLYLTLTYHEIRYSQLFYDDLLHFFVLREVNTNLFLFQ